MWKHFEHSIKKHSRIFSEDLLAIFILWFLCWIPFMTLECTVYLVLCVYILLAFDQIMKQKWCLVSIFKLYVEVTIAHVNTFILTKERQKDLIVFRVLWRRLIIFMLCPTTVQIWSQCGVQQLYEWVNVFNVMTVFSYVWCWFFNQYIILTSCELQ